MAIAFWGPTSPPLTQYFVISMSTHISWCFLFLFSATCYLFRVEIIMTQTTWLTRHGGCWLSNLAVTYFGHNVHMYSCNMWPDGPRLSFCKTGGLISCSSWNINQGDGIRFCLFHNPGKYAAEHNNIGACCADCIVKRSECVLFDALLYHTNYGRVRELRRQKHDH